MFLIIFQLSLIYILNHYINFLNFDYVFMDLFLKYIDYFELVDQVKDDLNYNYHNIELKDFYSEQTCLSKANISIFGYLRIKID